MYVHMLCIIQNQIKKKNCKWCSKNKSDKTAKAKGWLKALATDVFLTVCINYA